VAKPVADRQLITTDGRLVAEHLEIAATYWSRLKGLQFRRRLTKGRALLIVPCPSIHTFCLRFPLDVAFLNNTGQVVEVRHGLSPWRIAIPRWPAHAVIEAEAGWLMLRVGESLRIAESPGAPPLSRFAHFLK
jgi:hypothetical protein